MKRHCVCSRVNVQLRDIVVPLVNMGEIQPTEFRLMATVTVTVGVVSVMVAGEIVIVLLLIEFPFSTCCAAELAAVALPPGIIACRHP